MKLRICILGIILILFSFPKEATADDDFLFDDLPWTTVEIPFYTFANFTPQVALRMEYAKFEIQNIEEWHKISKKPYCL
jgi:hypothetical protein